MGLEQTVALVGMGGYGNTYVSMLLGGGSDPAGVSEDGAAGTDAPGGFRFAAVVDPFADRLPRAAEVASRGVTIFPTLGAMYERLTPDLVVVASPIQFHAQQACEALGRGSHVLCEKPLAATVDECLAIRDARDAAGRLTAVGFQWSFCPTIHALKRDVMSGRLGQPRRLRTIALWPRDERYYGRNRWAGRKRDDAGRPVFDSPVNNACAHFLHNMFYVLGDAAGTSAAPAEMTAELYRANDIENYDTAVLRGRTDGGVTVHFTVSHAVPEGRGPVLEYEFDDAVVRYDDAPGAGFVAHFRDGSTHDYGEPCHSQHPAKLLRTLRDARDGSATPCGVEAALPHARAVEMAAASGDVRPFPRPLLRVTGEPGARLTWVDGLAEVLTACNDRWELPSERGVPWASAGRTVTSAAGV